VNTYQALDTPSTDNESTDLLSAPDLHEESPDLLIPVDLTPPPVLHAPEFIVDVAIGDAAPPPVAPEASDATLGDVLTCALQCLDDKWTTILTTYNDAQDAQRCRDDEQRRLDREEQHRINAELHMSKKLEFDAFLVSSKDAFTIEMKDTFARFCSEFSTWKNSITPAAISLQATVAGTKFTEEVCENVTALSDEIRGNIMVLSETVKSMDEKVTRVHGHVTKTALPSLSSRLDILEQRATRVPIDVVGEPPRLFHPNPTTLPRHLPRHFRPNPTQLLHLQPYRWCCRWILRTKQYPRLPGSLLGPRLWLLLSVPTPLHRLTSRPG